MKYLFQSEINLRGIMIYIKFISWSILSLILVIAVNTDTTSAQLRVDKSSITTGLSGKILNNLNNPQLVELNMTLYSLSNEAKRDRIRNSKINIVGGAALTFGGRKLLNASNKDDAEGLGKVYAETIGTIFLVIGVASVAMGVYAIQSPSDVENYYIEFQNISETSPEESERKLIAGELRFEKLSDSARKKRHIYSGIYIAFGLSLSAESGDISDGILMIGAGAWKYFSKSKLEKAYDSYTTMKEIYSYTEADNNLSWNMFPISGNGIGGVVSLDF